IDLYFDFISPYSWLALERVEEFAAEHRVRFCLVPVVYAVLLDRTGLVGPAENPIKREYTFVDVVRTARAMGLSITGPPAHPFRSLEALRLVTRDLAQPHAIPLAAALARACWSGGEDLTDLDVLTRVARGVGADTAALADSLAAPPVKAALQDATERALAAGVFGVPTFDWRGELFWGQDRMADLGAALRSGREPITPAELRAMLRRPRGADRRGRPPA
ncbi:MAG: 2-hydroxychromene-2-carboxylate isomerase, partial [Planctomycetes bacterium]|nr:2-hydroxychromene-2-carboxylate isomerase [Planctomycetota bacterium]